MARDFFADRRDPFKNGDSVVVTLPKEELRRQGLLDEDDELVEDATARPYVDEDEGEIGAAVTLDD